MSTQPELDELKRRLVRLERELGEVRSEVAALERRETEAKIAAVRAEAASVAPPPLPPLVRPVCPPVAAPESVEAPEAFAAAPTVAEERPLSDWLRRVQLWPPETEAGGAEARLGAWWATRIGMFLAVVGVVFFGVYVSLQTPPWVKFLELVAVACGVAGLGLWLERRLAAFGSVVFAGGLALLFFAAYAGHAVAAVRVFESLAAGVLAQTAAVALIVGAALWRRSSGVATLAIGLGYVTAFVSGRGGLDGYALGAAVSLGAVAVALRRWRAWEGPSVVAMPASYAIFALGLAAARSAGAAQLPVLWWLAPAGLASLFFVRDWRRDVVDTDEVPFGEKVYQNANSALALVCGAGAALGWACGDLEWFYLGAAVWCGGAAWLRSRQVRGGDAVAAVLLAKMTGALALAVIEIAGARSAALALLAQAWVLAWTARRLGSRVLAAGTVVVALVATGFFFSNGLEPVALWSSAAAGAVVFSLGLAALAVEGGRWLVTDIGARRVVAALGAGAGGWALFLAVRQWTPEGWTPALWMGAAASFAALAWLRRSAAAAWAAAGLGVAANVGLWGRIWLESGPELAAWNGVWVLGPTVLAGCLPAAARWRTAAWAVAATGAGFIAFELLPPEEALAGLALLSAGLTTLAPGLRGRRLLWLATLVAGLATWQWLALGREMTGWSWLGFPLIWVMPVALSLVAKLDAARREETGAGLLEGVQVATGTLLALGVIVRSVDTGAQAVCAFSLLMVATGLTCWLGRVAKAGWALGPLGAMLAVVALVFAVDSAAGTVAAGFWAVVGAGLVLAALPLRPGAGASHWPRGVARVLGALSALAVWFALFAAQDGALEPYVTVGWGAAAIVIFMAGLFGRAVSYRIIGLLALFPCVLRVFLVDLHSTLHRIAAFIALGLVFLWVGFSYHRFRHLLVPAQAGEKSDSSPS